MQRPPTLADIARQLGVSKMTVSRALRRERHVERQLAERIRSTADHLGYRADPEISRLMTHLRSSHRRPSRETLGFVWSDATTPPTSPWAANLLEGAQARADELGYRLDCLTIVPHSFTARRIAEVLEHRGVRGFILSPLVSRSRGHLSLPWDRFACVAIGLGFSKPALHRVHHHHFLGMLTLMRQLKKRGYQRIGLAIPSILDRRMFSAWSACFIAHHPLPPNQAATCLHIPKELGRQRFLRWVADTRPDVVIDSGIALSPWLKSLGSLAPDAATLSWNPLAPELAGIDQRSSIIGHQAVDLLVEQLQRNDYGIPKHPKVLLTEGIWKPGSSLRRPLSHQPCSPTLTAIS